MSQGDRIIAIALEKAASSVVSLKISRRRDKEKGFIHTKISAFVSVTSVVAATEGRTKWPIFYFTGASRYSLCVTD